MAQGGEGGGAGAWRPDGGRPLGSADDQQQGFGAAARRAGGSAAAVPSSGPGRSPASHDRMSLDHRVTESSRRKIGTSCTHQAFRARQYWRGGSRAAGPDAAKENTRLLMASVSALTYRARVRAQAKWNRKAGAGPLSGTTTPFTWQGGTILWTRCRAARAGRTTRMACGRSVSQSARPYGVRPGRSGRRFCGSPSIPLTRSKR